MSDYDELARRILDNAEQPDNGVRTILLYQDGKYYHNGPDPISEEEAARLKRRPNILIVQVNYEDHQKPV